MEMKMNVDINWQNKTVEEIFNDVENMFAQTIVTELKTFPEHAERAKLKWKRISGTVYIAETEYAIFQLRYLGKRWRYTLSLKPSLYKHKFKFVFIQNSVKHSMTLTEIIETIDNVSPIEGMVCIFE